MNFKEAYQKMLEGNKVRRKGDNRYFYYDKDMKQVFYYISEKCFDRLIENIEMEDALAEDWEIVGEREAVEESKWKPREEELYFYINSNGEIEYRYYKNRNINDKRRICNIGNYFKTDEEAEHMLEKLKVIRELRDFALKHNDKEIDWSDCEQMKYVLFYNNLKVSVFFFRYDKYSPFDISFTSQELAYRAIEEIGEDRIKKYYFDIED